MKIQIHPISPKYINKKGNTVFRYIVKGTEAELKEYVAVKGEMARIDEATKEPLFFTTRYIGKFGELRKTSDGKDFVADDTEMVMFKSFVEQYGIDTAKVIWEKDKQKEVVLIAQEKIEGQK